MSNLIDTLYNVGIILAALWMLGCVVDSFYRCWKFDHELKLNRKEPNNAIYSKRNHRRAA